MNNGAVMESIFFTISRLVIVSGRDFVGQPPLVF